MNADSAKASDIRTARAPIRLQVTGMTCALCVVRVERSVRAIPGVQDARADLTTKTVSVVAAPGVTVDDLAMAVYRAGYDIATQDVALRVNGLTGNSSSAAVEWALAKVAGVTGVSVDLASGNAAVQALAGVSIDELTAAVKRVGYAAERAAGGLSAAEEPAARQRPEAWPAAPAEPSTMNSRQAADSDVVRALRALGAQTASLRNQARDDDAFPNGHQFALASRLRRHGRGAARY